FVEPPTPWWTGGDVLSGDWRPTWLALGLGALFILMELIPPLRDLFALERLGAVEWTLVVGSSVVWLFLVRLMWRTRILERLVSVDADSHVTRETREMPEKAEVV
ncbi:MAG TPA: hypothetical protein VH393_02200, partial [Ktedonobacterales bacterium]